MILLLIRGPLKYIYKKREIWGATTLISKFN